MYSVEISTSNWQVFQFEILMPNCGSSGSMGLFMGMTSAPNRMFFLRLFDCFVLIQISLKMIISFGYGNANLGLIQW